MPISRDDTKNITLTKRKEIKMKNTIDVKCPRCGMGLSAYDDGTKNQSQTLIKEHQEESEVYEDNMNLCDYWKKDGHKQFKASINRTSKLVNKLF